jgi:deoxyhypusine monooxygenase
VDPAPAAKKPTKEQVPEFERQLLDQSLPLFERYKAMFSLRNNRSRAAVLVSALLLRRHIALGYLALDE